MRHTFSQGSATVLQKMTKYEESRVKLTNSQLNKLKSEQIIRLEQHQEQQRKSFKMKHYLLNYY